MALNLLLSVFAIIIALVYFWIRKKYSFFEDNGFLHDKPTFPFGNLKGVGTKVHIVDILGKSYDKFKTKAKAFGLYFFLNHNVVVTDLDVIKDILIKDFENFHNRGLFSNPKDDPLTGHLFLIEDQAWKNMRVKLTPTFTSGKMKMMFDTLVNVADSMIDSLKNEKNLESIEVKNLLGNYTTDVIGNVAFGLELNSIKDPDAKFRQMGRKIFNQGANFQFKAFLYTSFRNLARKFHAKLLPEDVSEFFLGSLRQTVDYRIQNKIQRNDVLDLLIKLMSEDNSLTFNELAAQCFVFFVAGFETSSSTASFCLYFLATHQEIQEKLRKEIRDVLAKHNNEISYEAMQEMKYLQMVIDETLRLNGPVPQLLRVASNDYKIPKTDLTIPKGAITLIPAYAIHHDSDIYPDPEKFDPERFSDENKKNRHPMAFLPFGDGPRNCIGNRFGYMQTKIALIKLLQNFNFKTTAKTIIPIEIDPVSITLSPRGGVWLGAEKI